MAVGFDVGRHFDPERIEKLKAIAEHLTPHAEDIVNNWVDRQRAFEVAPLIARERLLSLFTMLFYGTLDAMRSGNIVQYLDFELPIIGKSLVEAGFPYENLVITVHFLEESYLPYLSGIHTKSDEGRADIDAYISIDELWHFWTAELTYAYFYEIRRSLSEEAEIGRAIQEAIMPRLPTRIGCIEIGSFYASATTGAKIGGDIIDIVNFDNKVQHIFLSDFSGSGLRASIKAANIRSLFRGFAIEDDSPLMIANRLNRILFSELNPAEFDTGFLARFDQSDRTVRYVNAGHLGPVLIDAEGTSILPEGDNPALGMFRGSTFMERSFTLNPGSTLIMYSDGITEARNGNVFFEVEGIIKSAQRNLDKTTPEIAAAIWADCLDFADGKVSDDVAILVLRCY